MNNNTTVTSNDESRKEAKTSYVSDEEVRTDIENWDEGKGVFVAAIDWEAIIAKETEQQDGTTGTSDTNAGRKRRIRVGSKVSKGLNTLIIDPLVTVGAKPEKGKFKKAREESKKIKASKREEQEKE